MTTTTAAPTLDGAGTPRPNALVRLYRGETSFDFVGRRRRWYLISILVILAGIASFGIRGLNLGIEFRGGTSWEVLAPGVSAAKVTSVLRSEGVSQPVVQILGGKTVDAQADLNSLPAAQRNRIDKSVAAALGKLAHVPASQVSLNEVGPTWGGQVTQKAINALLVFFVLIVVYISVRFEWKMAVAALVAVVHDLLVTAGVYSLTGLQVTPDTVIAILTILGYSLYDTVVVFDRVGENTKGLGASGRMTYEDVVNLSMNQVLARSVNTSLVAIIPVLSVLLIGAELLGATTLQEFGLALVIGLTSGAYSSIFIASPLLSQMKEREPRYASIRQKLASRGDRSGLLTPRAAALLTSTAPAPGSQRSGSAKRPASRAQGASRPGGVIKPGRAQRPGGQSAVARAGTAQTGTAQTGTTQAGTAQAGAGRPAGTRRASSPPARGGSGGSPAAGSAGSGVDGDGSNVAASTAGAQGGPAGPATNGAPDAAAPAQRSGAAKQRAPGQRRPPAKARKGKGGRRR